LFEVVFELLPANTGFVRALAGMGGIGMGVVLVGQTGQAPLLRKTALDYSTSRELCNRKFPTARPTNATLTGAEIGALHYWQVGAGAYNVWQNRRGGELMSDTFSIRG
jgi:hypothetical protein